MNEARRLAKASASLLVLTLFACSPPDVPSPTPKAPGGESASQPLLAHSARQLESGIFVGTKDSERFGIMLPQGFPMPGFQQQETEDMTANVYMSKLSEERVALFGWNAYAKPVTNEEYLLEHSVEQAAKQMEGRVTQYNQMQLGRWKGAQVWVAAGHGEETKVARYDYWAIPPYLFQIGFMTPDAEELESEKVREFFDSFRFGGLMAASAVVEPAEIPIIY